jgi:hypothetical protein
MWKWLQIPALALMLLAAFGPLPDRLDRVFSFLGAALSLAYVGIASWEDRRERRGISPAAISSSDQHLGRTPELDLEEGDVALHRLANGRAS